MYYNKSVSATERDDFETGCPVAETTWQPELDLEPELEQKKTA